MSFYELTNEQTAEVENQALNIEQCRKYFFENATVKTENGVITGFDSMNTAPKKRPDILNAMFDSMNPEYHSYIDQALSRGINAYKKRHGGDMPDPSVLATALSAGLGVFDFCKKNAISGFDSMTNNAYEQSSIVPSLSATTVSNIIGSASPIVAMIPNTNQSVNIPLVNIRFSADKTFGAMKAGDLIDGEGTGLPYAEGRFSFALQTTDQIAYEVPLHTSYDNYDLATPDTKSQKLAVLGGNIALTVNGLEVGTTRGNRENSATTGEVAFYRSRKGIDIKGKNYSLLDGTVNLDESLVKVKFSEALPKDAIVKVKVIADFNKIDLNGKFAIDPVGVSVVPDYSEIQAVPSTQHINMNKVVAGQLAREVGVGFAGVALATIQGKMFLEQNLRLLREGRDRAKYNGRTSTFDVSRSVNGNLASAFNSTSDLMAELLKFIDTAKIKIRQASNGATNGYDLYVSDVGAVFINQLAGSRFTSTGLISCYGEIVRIGTLSDGTNVYHTPTVQKVLKDAQTTDGLATEMMLIGRGNEAIRNPFIGSMPQPPIITQVSIDSRREQYGINSVMASELNPFDQYADQIVMINLINLVNTLSHSS